MAALKDFALGFTKGATKSRAEQLGDERRADKAMDVWQIQQMELQRIRGEDRQAEQAFTMTQDEANKEHERQLLDRRLEQDLKKHHESMALQEEQLELEKAKGVTLGKGQANYEIVENPDGSVSLEQRAKNVDGTGGLDPEALIKVDKQFMDHAMKLFKVENMSFDQLDEQTQNSIARTAAIASELVRERPDLPTNSIFLRSFEHVKENPSVDIASIRASLAAKEEEFFKDEEDLARIEQLRQQEAEALENRYSTETPDLSDMPRRGGMLSRDTAPAAAPAPAPTSAPMTGVIDRTEAGAAAPPAEMLQEGIATPFRNGQVWTLQGGKPMRVR